MSRFASVAGEQVAELAELCTEPGRLSRGRALFRKGSVADLSVIEGSVIASVRGSEGDVYETTVGTAPAPPGVVRQIAQVSGGEERPSVDDLIGQGIDVCPGEVDLAFGCDCADWDEPCKHVVAVLLALADRVDLDEDELLRWRGIDTAGPESEAELASARELGTDAADEQRPEALPRWRSRAAKLAPEPEPVDRTAKLSELEALLGDTVMRVPADDGSSGSDPDPGSGSATAVPIPTLNAGLADFFGVGIAIEPVDLGQIPAPEPLFADVQLGPLAELGPALAQAMAVIATRLEAAHPSDL